MNRIGIESETTKLLAQRSNRYVTGEIIFKSFLFYFKYYVDQVFQCKILLVNVQNLLSGTKLNSFRDCFNVIRFPYC